VRALIDERALKVALQPVVDLSTRKPFAYEALVRSDWPAFASPPRMFEAAVREGCVGELGRLIREVAIDLAPDHRLFLNVHPSELNERWLIQPDDPIFRHTEDVFLEITESVPLSHFVLCQSMLQEIRGKGIYLVVDDLGAGYSNLKYIVDLSPRVVKLDRELVAGLTRGSRLHRLVTSLVRLCRELDASVVAEGIETADELRAVCEAGVRYGQGYLLARPAFAAPPVHWPEHVPSRAGDAYVDAVPPSTRSDS
jgi:EAL domain-containing protein (putative c-di-GMP-specific phosphodiesterase class I)